MGCSSCGSGAMANTLNRKRSVAKADVTRKNNYIDPSCPYSQEVLSNFDSKLTWLKVSKRYNELGVTAHLLNKYLGITRTSLAINNKCKYAVQLVKISDLSILITNLQNV